jgi:hypothetical protein
LGYTYTITATNHEGDPPSPASPQSAPTVYASGHPDQITDLSVAADYNGGTGQELSATFTLPPSNSSGISQVDYTINGQEGSWPHPGASGDSVTEYISGLTNGTSYTVSAEACSENSGGTSGGCGEASTTSSAIPYGQPNPPAVSATQNGDSIDYSWGGGGNNGSSVASYYVCIQGSCQSYAASGSPSVAYACGTGPYTITGYVVDEHNDDSTTASSSASTAACPSPTITISQGAHSTTTGCHGSATCSWINVTMTGFTPNTSYVETCYDKNGEFYSSQGAFTYTTNSAGNFSVQPTGSTGPGCADSSGYGPITVQLGGRTSNQLYF